MQFEGEVEVVVGRAAGIAKELAVDGEESAQAGVRRVGLVIEHIRLVALQVERQRQRL
ncbi:hypothetical protein D3C83_228820 [compost metagenome]